MIKRWIQRILLVLTLFAGALAPMTSVEAQESEFAGQKVRVGVVGDESEELWLFVADKAKDQYGIELEVVLLTDYNIPNEALSDGSLDLNAFQHDVFLENWNKENQGDLVTLAYTVAVPTRIYSEEYDHLDDLPQGAKIALNNAPTSLSYNLQTLERAGLITLKDDAELLPTTDDVADNPKDLELIELDGAQIPSVLPDVDAAFIDDSFLSGTDFEPGDAIYVYGDTAETINLDRVNNIVARKEDEDSPLYQVIVELYQSEDVADKIEEVFNGGSIPAWDLVQEAKDKE